MGSGVASTRLVGGVGPLGCLREGNCPSKIVATHRLGQHTVDRSRRRRVYQFRISGHQEASDGRIGRTEFRQKFHAGAVREILVAEYEIEGPGHETRQGFLDIGLVHDRVPVSAEQQRQDLGHRDVILDKENPQCSVHGCLHRRGFGSYGERESNTRTGSIR
jgi:hypothetical protein